MKLNDELLDDIKFVAKTMRDMKNDGELTDEEFYDGVSLLASEIVNLISDKGDTGKELIDLLAKENRRIGVDWRNVIGGNYD